MAAKLNLTALQLDQARSNFERNPGMLAIHYDNGTVVRREDLGL
jgi:hypothetical protein